MRCPEVIVGSVNDIISTARNVHRLHGRIEKPYKHFEPVKGKDSRLYPKIWLVETSVQRKNANYFGRFINEVIEKIPQTEIEEANKKAEPVVLIIGSRQYLRQIEDYLAEAGRAIESREDHSSALSAERAFELLKKNPESNLGWRIILELRKRGLAISCVREAGNKTHLHELIPEDFKKSILEEMERFVPPTDGDSVEAEDKQPEGLTIRLTSFEGAKGLSAQHVFLVGLQAGDLPRDEMNIRDLEICKFLVGLTRTKKRCAIMLTKRFGIDWKQPSIFLRWINEKRYERLSIDVRSWGGNS
jgi:superfamily I DNA/RNA helicase